MNALEAAGLTKNEAKLYKLLLHLNTANITELAKRSGIHRRSVYDVLMRLSEKGLASYIVAEGVKVYAANNPEKLKELIEEKRKAIKDEMPSLIKTFEENAKKKSTQFFVGKKGVLAILEEQIRLKKEVLVLGASHKANEILKYYMPKYGLLRKENNIPMKLIYSGQGIKDSKIPLAQIKHMPEGIGGDVAFNIYGDNVALLMWNKEQPFAILMHDDEIAKSFRDYFEFIWNSL